VLAAIIIFVLIANAFKDGGSIVDGAKRFFAWVKSLFNRHKMKKQKQEKVEATLDSVEAFLKDFSEYYSDENIKKRNDWMNWVNEQAEEYNKTLENINKRLTKLDVITEETRLDQQRNAILDFAARVNNPRYDYSREHFKKIFKTIKAYEEYIEENNLTNGEVDAAVEKIEKAYEEKKNSDKIIW
jgi:vacuolar-type H+-ATPase subunit I/STV1